MATPIDDLGMRKWDQRNNHLCTPFSHSMLFLIKKEYYGYL
jgi:hypothetical protein